MAELSDAEVQQAVADSQVRNVLARIAQLSDTGEVKDYVSLFTDDAVWEMPDNPGIGLAGSVRTGRDDIEAGVHERRGTGMQGPGSDALHVIATTSVRADGDVAHAHSYFQYFVTVSKAPTIQTMGQYQDTFRRTPDGWKLAHRIITFG